MWCIPPEQDAAFVCAMEQVLSFYKRPLNPDCPVVCMDETSVQGSTACAARQRQCLNRRLADKERVRREIDAWTTTRDRSAETVQWRFTTEDARIKLKQLYPTISYG